jgi:hypothetical protein
MAKKKQASIGPGKRKPVKKAKAAAPKKAKGKFNGDQRTTYIRRIALHCLNEAMSKTAALVYLKDANKQFNDPPLLAKDMPSIYAWAVKEHKKQNNALLGDMEGDAEQAIGATDEKKVAAIITLSREFMKLENTIAKAQQALATPSARYIEIRDKELPEALKAAGVKAMPLANGWSVAMAERWAASLPTPAGIDKANPEQATKLKKRLADALLWLRDNGHEDLIKNQVVAKFGRGETRRVDGLVNVLMKRNIDYDQQETVNSNTLAAFIKEQIGEGAEVPTDLFGAHLISTAKLVPPKKN